jgi:excisionase family DNA binding protein
MISHADDDLLRPGEAATMFGIRVVTLARWAREGRLTVVLTPGAHRRYRRTDLERALGIPGRSSASSKELAEDAVRLYEQGWSIRQVAQKFDLNYGAARRLLRARTTLRDRGGSATR